MTTEVPNKDTERAYLNVGIGGLPVLHGMSHTGRERDWLPGSHTEKYNNTVTLQIIRMSITEGSKVKIMKSITMNTYDPQHNQLHVWRDRTQEQ